MIAPAKENNTGTEGEKRRSAPRQCTHFWKRMMSVQYTRDSLARGSINLIKPHQALEILSVLASQAAIRLPHPIPTGRMATTSSEKHHSVIRLHWFRCRSDAVFRITEAGETHRIDPGMTLFGCDSRSIGGWDTRRRRGHVREQDVIRNVARIREC